MPTERAKKRALKDKREGKAPTTQAGEFIKEEMEKLKTGTGRAKSREQAVAIGLSEARREGVAVGENPQPSDAAEAAQHHATGHCRVAIDKLP